MSTARRISLTTAGLLLAHLPSAVNSTPCVELEDPFTLRDEFDRGYEMEEIVLDGDVLYAVNVSPCCEGFDTGSYNRVFDASDPDNLVWIDTFILPGSDPPEALRNLSAGGQVVCGVPLSSSGDLYIGDTSDPTDVSLVSLTPPGLAGMTATAVGSGYAYATNGTFVVIDVSDPGAPFEVGRVTVGHAAQEMIAGDGVVFVAGGTGGLHVMDVSSPASPSALATLAVSHDVEDIALDGTFVYAAGADGSGIERMTVIDVSNPAGPVTRGSTTVTGDDIAADGGVVVLVEDEVIVAVDVTDPDDPREAAGTFGPPGDVTLIYQGVVLAEGMIFSAGFYTGSGFSGFPPLGVVHVHSLGALPEPTLVNVVPSPAELGEMVATDSHAYVLDELGTLHVIDLSTPELPVFVGSVATGPRTELWGPWRNVAHADGLVFVTHPTDGLYIVDVSVPTGPVVTALESSGPATDVVAQGALAYVVGSGGLRIVDVADPSAPVVTSTLGGSSSAVGVSGTTLLRLRGSDLVILSVFDPESPVELDVIGSVSGQDILVDGDIAYVLSGWSLTSIDISDPTDAFVLSTANVGGSSLAGVGSVLHTSGRKSLGAVEITDPAALDVLGSYVSSTLIAWSVAASGEYVYGAGDGLHVIMPACAAAVDVPAGGTPPALGLVPLHVYPAPIRTRAFIRLRSDVADSERIRVSVLDVGGRLVDRVALLRERDSYLGVWEPHEVAAGVYFVRVKTGVGSITERVVKLE